MTDQNQKADEFSKRYLDGAVKVTSAEFVNAKVNEFNNEITGGAVLLEFDYSTTNPFYAGLEDLSYQQLDDDCNKYYEVSDMLTLWQTVNDQK